MIKHPRDCNEVRQMCHQRCDQRFVASANPPRMAGRDRIERPRYPRPNKRINRV